MPAEAVPAGRLYWRCRRGTTELDRVLGAYLEEEYADAPKQVQSAFADLLEQQDPDIYDWLMGWEQADDEFATIIDLLQRKYIHVSRDNS